VSRLQRDLTDSTVLRNIGVPMAHTILAIKSVEKGLSKLVLNEKKLYDDLESNWAVVAEANRYFAGEAPWALAKTDPQRQRTVLYVTAEVIRQIAILTQPVMPESSSKMLDMLGIPSDQRNFAVLNGATRIKAGTALPAPTGIFPRYIEPTAV